MVEKCDREAYDKSTHSHKRRDNSLHRTNHKLYSKECATIARVSDSPLYSAMTVAKTIYGELKKLLTQNVYGNNIMEESNG